MNGPVPVALVALLALASTVAAVPPGVGLGGAEASTGPEAPGSGPAAEPLDSASAPVVSQPNTTEYLAIPTSAVRTQRFGTATIGVSDAVDADVGHLEAAFTRRQLAQAYAAAETDEERRRVLRRATDRVAASVQTLRSRERAALTAYNADDISTQTYVRKLAVQHARAQALQGVVLALEERVDRMDRPPVNPTRLARFEARLLPLQGPIRDRLAGVIAGEADGPGRVYVETSAGGVVLAVIVEWDGGTQYVREAYLPKNRRPAAPDSFDGSIFAAVERFKSIYPWAWNNQNGFSTGSTELRHVGVYQFTVVHPQGRLTAYLDGGTNTTFLEYQSKSVAEVPLGPTVNETADGLRLIVNRSRTGGPLEVRVLNASTGEPVDATITVDERRLGRTGADGRLWTIAPPVRFTVGASVDDRQVTLQTFSRRNV